MPSKIEKEYNDPPKPKKRKKYCIYYKYTEEAWKRIRELNISIFKHNNWQLWGKYHSEKARDNALEQLRKNKNHCYNIPLLDSCYIYIKGEDLDH